MRLREGVTTLGQETQFCPDCPKCPKNTQGNLKRMEAIPSRALKRDGHDRIRTDASSATSSSLALCATCPPMCSIHHAHFWRI